MNKIILGFLFLMLVGPGFSQDDYSADYEDYSADYGDRPESSEGIEPYDPGQDQPEFPMTGNGPTTYERNYPPADMLPEGPGVDSMPPMDTYDGE